MAKFSDLPDKTNLDGTESVSILDSDVLKKTTIDDVSSRVSNQLGIRQTNLSTNPVSFSKSFEADTDLEVGDGVTLFRENNVIKAKGLGTGIIVSPSAEATTKDTNLQDFDINLANIYWNPNATRDSQLMYTQDGASTPANHFKFIDQDHSTYSVPDYMAQPISDDEVIIHGYATNITRILQFGVGNDPDDILKAKIGDDIITNVNIAYPTLKARNLAFIIIFKRESDVWTIKEAVGIPLGRVRELLNSGSVLKSLNWSGHRAYFRPSSSYNDSAPVIKIKDNTYYMSMNQESSPNLFSSTSYSSNTSLSNSTLGFPTNDYPHNFFFNIEDSKVKLIYEETNGYWHNFSIRTTAQLSTIEAGDTMVTTSKFWDTNGSTTHNFIPLDPDISGDRTLIIIVSRGGYNNGYLYLFNFTLEGNKFSISFSDFAEGIYSRSTLNFGGGIGGMYRKVLKNSQGDFLGNVTKYGTVTMYEFKDNQSYLLQTFNTTLNRFLTKAETLALVNGSPLALSLEQQLVNNPLASYQDFIESSDDHRQFIRFNIDYGTLTFRRYYYYKNDIDRVTTSSGDNITYLEQGETSGVSTKAVFSEDLQNGAFFYRYIKNNFRSRIRYRSLLSQNRYVTSGDNSSLIGFSTEAVSKGENVNISFISQGTILTFFTGLLAGFRYFYDATDKLNTENKGKLIGLAISSTEIVVQNG